MNFKGGITLFNNEKAYGVILNIVLSFIIQWIWSLMTDMSFLTILSLISITVPGVAKIIQSALFGFICMDLLYTDRWLIPLLTSFKTDKDYQEG
jgi:hypothetical protein